MTDHELYYALEDSIDGCHIQKPLLDRVASGYICRMTERDIFCYSKNIDRRTIWLNILCTSSGIVNLRSPQNDITRIKESGFEEILFDFSAYCPANELEYIGEKSLNLKSAGGFGISEHPEKLSDYLKPLLENCRKNSVGISVARAPYLKRDTKRTDLNELLIRLTEESIRVCGQAGIRCLIVRPLFSGVERGLEWKVNREYYLGLTEVARENNVTILLENQCRDNNGHLVRGICSDAEEAAVWVDRLNGEAGEKRFGFCMDVGACTLCGQDMLGFATVLGSRIKVVILRDCNGHDEASMLPFTCVSRERTETDWLGLIRGLREIEFDGSIIMDFSSMAAAFSPLLRQHLLPLAKAVADYFKLQISIKTVLKKYETRVLFGAGNMCRNYMKCYGEEFPPLFTCDNNPERWGEMFEGLEIKAPEALKELDSDCAIFICNVYYGEIEQQLRAMGLANPIEFFNDEYMPSYYFDRLEEWKGAQQ